MTQIFFAKRKKNNIIWRRRRKNIGVRCKNLAFYTTESLNEPFFAEQKRKNGAAGKKKFGYSLYGTGFHGAVSNPVQGSPKNAKNFFSKSAKVFFFFSKLRFSLSSTMVYKSLFTFHPFCLSVRRLHFSTFFKHGCAREAQSSYKSSFGCLQSTLFLRNSRSRTRILSRVSTPGKVISFGSRWLLCSATDFLCCLQQEKNSHNWNVWEGKM